MIGGGPCVYNPEPLAEFFDLFYIGEGETVYDELLDTYKKCRAEGSTRTEFLEQAARIEGIYVPSFMMPNTTRMVHFDHLYRIIYVPLQV